MANNAIMIFDGTPSTVITTTATIADGVFTVASTNSTITEFDNSGASDKWPLAVASLKLVDGFASSPTAGKTIDLFYSRQDLAGDTADDEAAPSTTAQQGAKYLGSFRLYNTGAQNHEIVISLAGIRKAKFYLQNNSGQTISFSSGSTLEIEGFTLTPST